MEPIIEIYVSQATAPVLQLTFSQAIVQVVSGPQTGQTRYLNSVLEYYDGADWLPVPIATGPPPTNNQVPYVLPFFVN